MRKLSVLFGILLVLILAFPVASFAYTAEDSASGSFGYGIGQTGYWTGYQKCYYVVGSSISWKVVNVYSKFTTSVSRLHKHRCQLYQGTSLRYDQSYTPSGGKTSTGLYFTPNVYLVRSAASCNVSYYQRSTIVNSWVYEGTTYTL